MAVLRVRERAATVIQKVLEDLSAPDDVVEWDVCTTWAELTCPSHDEDEQPHQMVGQVLVCSIGLSCPESDATSTVQWMMPLNAATDDYLAESIQETWENLVFSRRAHELSRDLDLDALARELDGEHDHGQ